MIVISFFVALYLAWATGKIVEAVLKPLLPKSKVEKLRLEVDELNQEIEEFRANLFLN